MVRKMTLWRGREGTVNIAEIVPTWGHFRSKPATTKAFFWAEGRRGTGFGVSANSETERIKIRAEVTEPDVLIVLDPGLLQVGDVVSRLKKDGTAVINTMKSHDEMKSELSVNKLATVDAMSIARAVLGLPIVNTTMLGAMIKATGIVKLESLESPLEERFGKVAMKNIEAMKEAYAEAVVS